MKKSLQVLSLVLLVSTSVVAEEAATQEATEATRTVVETKEDAAMDVAAFTKALADAIDAMIAKHAETFKDLSNEALILRKAKMVTALLEGASELTTTTAQRKYIEEKVDAKALLESQEEATEKATEVAA